MQLDEALGALEAAGSAQCRKIYARHGVAGEQFGVSYGALNKLAKQIRRDHDLAVRLWDTGNHDARVLATMIADPAAIAAAQLDAWAKSCDNYIVTDALSKFVASTPHASAKATKWSKSKTEYLSAAGWNLVAAVARDDALDGAWFAAFLSIVERDVHKRPNRTRHSMVSALCAIGIARAALRDEVFRVARAIGPVEVDHGETSCKTPDPIPYIEQALESLATRGKRGAARQGASKKSTAKSTRGKAAAKKRKAPSRAR